MAHQPSTIFLMPASFSRPVGPSWMATSFMTRATSSSGMSSRPFLLAAAGSTCAMRENVFRKDSTIYPLSKSALH